MLQQYIQIDNSNIPGYLKPNHFDCKITQDDKSKSSVNTLKIIKHIRSCWPHFAIFRTSRRRNRHSCVHWGTTTDNYVDKTKTILMSTLQITPVILITPYTGWKTTRKQTALDWSWNQGVKRQAGTRHMGFVATVHNGKDSTRLSWRLLIWRSRKRRSWKPSFWWGLHDGRPSGSGGHGQAVWGGLITEKMSPGSLDTSDFLSEGASTVLEWALLWEFSGIPISLGIEIDSWTFANLLGITLSPSVAVDLSSCDTSVIE